VADVTETDVKRMVRFADEQGNTTDTWETWKLSAYPVTDGIAFHPECPAKLIPALLDSALQNEGAGAYVVIVQRKDPDLYFGSLGYSLGPVKRPLLVPPDQNGGDELDEPDIVSLWDAVTGECLWMEGV